MMTRFHAYTENCYSSSKQTVMFSENQVTSLILLVLCYLTVKAVLVLVRLFTPDEDKSVFCDLLYFSFVEVVFYHVLTVSDFCPIRHLQETLLKNQLHRKLNKLLPRYAFYPMNSDSNGVTNEKTL